MSPSLVPFDHGQPPTGGHDESGGETVGPYAYGAFAYLAAGWDPIPLGVGRRNSPPVGVTGARGRSVTAEDVAAWVAARGGDNLGLRLPQGVVGIDVDCHDGKLGGEQLLILEARHGKLPPTWHSTSRDDGSRIAFYRCPPHVAVNLKDLAPDVELIRHWYRYAAVWPSVNEKTGLVYRWWSADGALMPEGAVPAPGDLADLPEAWYGVVPLQVSGSGEAFSFSESGGGDFTDPDVDELLRFGVPAGARQDPMLRDLVWKLVGAGLSDLQIELQWLAVVSKTPQLDERLWTVVDFNRHLRGARAKLGSGTAVPVAWVAGLDTSGVATGGTGEAAGLVGTGEAMPSPSTPMPVARRLLPELTEAGTGVPTLMHWRGAWMRWQGDHWSEEELTAFRNWLYRRLERETWLRTDKDGQVETLPWNPVRRSVGEVETAIEALRMLPQTVEVGAHLVDGEWVRPVVGTMGVACQNGVVDPVTRALSPHSPARFITSAVPFDYDEHAACPGWLSFLDQVLPGDAEAVRLLQEWFGYVVSGRVDQQKMLLMVGASRSGKSTTAKVLSKLMGPGNTAAPTMASFASNFGLSSLIGRSLAVMDDIRFSAKLDIQVVIERLLTITSNGQLDVDRKNRSIWSGRLPTRLTIASNELPWLTDASGAVVNRLLVIEFNQSFLGKEDVELEARLEPELSGVLNWALDGLTRLMTVGSFTVPGSSREAVDDLHEQASPVQAFTAERCETGEGFQVDAEALFLDWLLWAGNVKDDKSARTSFGMRLRAGCPGLKKERITVKGVKTSVYHGVRLRSQLPEWAGGQLA